MKRLIICGTLFMLTLTGFSQNYTAQWLDKPMVHKVKPAFENESAVILQDIRVHEYVMDEAKKELVILSHNRQLIKILDDKGVEMFNKIYVPVNRSMQITELKARTILPNGKVVELPADKILEVEEEGRLYKKFAMEGVEVGCEVEYSYEARKPLGFFGLEVFHAGSVPFEQAIFSLITPGYLSFTAKGYNGIKTITDTIANNQRVIVMVGLDIAGMNEEKYSTKDAHIANVQYKFSYNLSKSKTDRVFTWNELATNVYNQYTSITDKESKSVEGFLKQSGIKDAMSTEEKIVQLEDYIKNTVNSDKEGIGEDADKIEKIIKNKVSSEEGLNKLFIACLEKLKIPYQIVFPSKRDEIPLDEQLENFRLAEEIVLYFPESGKFLEPASPAFRYPFITPYWAATKGLFIKGSAIGNAKTASGSFGDIPIQPVEKSAHNMIISLKFNAAMDSLELHSNQILVGYGAAFYRPAYAFTSKDKLEELSKSIISSVAKSDDIRNIKVTNEGMTDGFTEKQMTVEGDITTATLFEVAGKKLLIKIGEVIGPQVEMYQEKKRLLPISLQYPHLLDRDIFFTIPDGYQIKNLNEIVFNITDKAESGKETMGFISSYDLKDNILSIKVHEFYNATDYPVDMIAPFMKVINASADFNKVVLILEKK